MGVIRFSFPPLGLYAFTGQSGNKYNIINKYIKTVYKNDIQIQRQRS